MTDKTDPKPIAELKERFDRFSDEFFDRLRAEWPEERTIEAAPDGKTQVADPWPVTLLGTELVEHGKKWLADLSAGRPEALALTGQWLQVRSADEKLFPNLLRSLGEAFYRWSPKTEQSDDPLEKALIRSLNDRAVKLGLRNSIESVGPGDRFDANRHNPLPGQRGMTVDAVLGWTVMRDDRVFAKATVSVK